ncbi:unnamed protein product [Paramecium pentaurelia]|uniref:Dynein heavy chain coiled coil stalk domain-containing protein n=1 Tax=Paramecium pentaurelia TaxID=43138 RepID=A0A8S1YL00_9CILI|nr:unnamed protein product [Paramecium pentaurelia]
MNNKHQNYFMTVRTEVVLQICQFLDIKSYLQLRLVNSDMDFIVKLINKQKINEIRFRLINLQEDNEEILKCRNLIEQDKQKLRQHWTSIFNKIYFIEIKALSSPPQILLEIIKYFVFLMNPIDQLSKDNYSYWVLYKQLVANLNILIIRIFEFEPERISKNKLEILQQIYEFNQKYIHFGSNGIEFMYQYIVSIIEVRKRDYYDIYYDYQTKLQLYDKMIQQLEKLDQKFQNEIQL